MKKISFVYRVEQNIGTNEKPEIFVTEQKQIIGPFHESELEERLSYAKGKSIDGEVIIEDDGQPESEPSREEKLEAEVAELKEALDLLLSGVTE